MALWLKNPHSVTEAIRCRPKEVLKITVPSSFKAQSSDWAEVLQLAEKARIPVEVSSGPRAGSSRQERGTQVQAQVRDKSPVDLEELFKRSSQKEYGLWLALDQIQDPGNLGSIFRTAAFFGVNGIVLTRDQSAGLSETVYDVSSGGVEHVPFSIQVNLRRALEEAKEKDIWILGTSEHEQGRKGQSLISLSEVESDRNWMLVLGNEEKGMRRLTEESCDVYCRIPGQGQIGSLNVAVAAAILISKMKQGIRLHH